MVTILKEIRYWNFVTSNVYVCKCIPQRLACANRRNEVSQTSTDYLVGVFIGNIFLGLGEKNFRRLYLL